MNLKADQPLSTLSVRAEPVQQRSAERITNLLDAAAELIDQSGIDGLTTSDVATRSGSSVGVVYRYFPNIQSLLKALAARNKERFMARIREVLPDHPATIDGSMSAIIDSYIELARTEPGFRALRFGDIIDDRFLGATPPTTLALTGMFQEILVERYNFRPSEELSFELEVLVQIGDTMLHQAFRYDPTGDTRWIAKLRELASATLAPYTTA
jgi:AcrR family transcriptional regulator